MRIHQIVLLLIALGAVLVAPGVQAFERTVAAPDREYLSVTLDLATIVKVPTETATMVIGNPAIADAVLLQDGKGQMVLTPRSYGLTNIMLLDSAGAPLREMMIRVEQAARQTVTVQRGMARETWSCTPRCEQTLTLGDTPEFFNGTNAQIGTRNATAGAR